MLQCKFCQRDCKSVGPKYYLDEEDNTAVCFDCGVGDKNPEASTPPQPVSKTPPKRGHRPPKDPALGLDALNLAIAEVLNTMEARLTLGFSYQSDSQKSTGDFICFVERQLILAKMYHSNEDPLVRSKARPTMVHAAALIMAYLQSHPHE